MKPFWEWDIVNNPPKIKKLKEEFYDAAILYCYYWTQDSRNTNNPQLQQQKLDKSRHNLYQAFQRIEDWERKWTTKK